ncbi:MAG: class II aldolase/adducin family protein [Alphaproteobacteria bacterium]
MTATVTRLDKVRDPVRQARIDLAAAYRLANRFGYDDGIWNHFTLAVPGAPDRFLVKRHGLLMSEVTASNLIVVGADGQVVEGDGIVERTAFCIHSRIHALVADATCVLHVHPPYCAWLANVAGGRLAIIHQDSMRFHERIAYDDDYDGFADDPAEGERMARAFGDKPILLSRNHGVTVTARSVAEAFYDLHYLEIACARQHLVAASGRTAALVPTKVLDRLRNAFRGDASAESARLTFDALKRQLDREAPGYDA